MKTIVTVKRVTPLSGMEHFKVYKGDMLEEVFAFNNDMNEEIARTHAMNLAAKLENESSPKEEIIYQTPKS